MLLDAVGKQDASETPRAGVIGSQVLAGGGKIHNNMADITIAGFTTVFETRHLSIHISNQPGNGPYQQVTYRAHGYTVAREDFLALLQAQETAK